MARGQKGWQKTTAGTFWFSSFAAGLFVVACLVAGTLDFLLFPKPSSSFVGHFHGSCHDYLACPMTEDWVLAPEVTEISPAVEPVVTSISPGVRICLISPADEGTCVPQVASTPTVHGDRGRFNKGNKRVFGALSTIEKRDVAFVSIRRIDP